MKIGFQKKPTISESTCSFTARLLSKYVSAEPVILALAAVSTRAARQRREAFFDKERVDGTDAKVDTRVLSGEETVSINYMMHQVNGRWLIYD
jgi:hypothetical protein